MIGKDKWAEIISNFHKNPAPNLIERETNIPKQIPLKRAISIIGPRRAGKTYTVFQVIKDLIKNKVSVNQILYVNLEKTDLEGCTIKDLSVMIETFYEIYPENKRKKIWLCLDEVQNVDNWEKFVRTVIDDENVQVFVTGSSSKLLSKEIATSLRGRTITYTLLPFSFIDYLTVDKIKPPKYFSSEEKVKIINRLTSYMNDGGYPEVVLYKKEKEKLLQEIVETTIYRDVIERFKIRNTKLLKLLMKSLINSACKEFSVHKFFNFVKSMGIRASKKSFYNYVDALNDVFFVFPLRKFSYAYRESEQSLPKIYLIDNGILSSNGINDKGKLLENLVFIELLRRGKNIYYYKSIDNKEVDFLILEKRKVKQLIQVAYSIDDLTTREREIKSLLKASKDLKCNDLSLVTWDKNGQDKINGKTIKFIPLWKWLLLEK